MSTKKTFSHFLPDIRLPSRKQKDAGAAPGTIEHIGERHLDEVQIIVRDYDENQLNVESVPDIHNVQPFLEAASNTWIQVSGLHDTDKLTSIWEFFDLHPLIREDIVNTAQRPKVEFYDNCVFFVMRMLNYSDQELTAEQISIVLGNDFVLCFQETGEDYFNPIVKRLSTKDARIRKQGTDYLTYALIDTVVDYYFNIINHLADEIEQVEDELLEESDTEQLNQIHKLRREIIFFRKSIWPLRDAVNATIRDETTFIEDNTKIYLRDVYDHMIQLIDNIEHYRDMMLGMHDMYMSQVSNRMNEVMKVLTIIATIFIPLTFIAGIYGMNFNPENSPYNMPELSWYWGYPASLGFMTIIALIMIYYFKRKGWF
ncbi:magnesium transporter [Fodinibius salinus]|uniref:Magnesium transport protein CorA n=1 Tax=Fodinibius salinus TaxID=860790 RepID=A0A5D3YNP0_9BACT|nr:magnesium/cobalt transporter CorA [Fodinibius salinus]TYP95550.1 magnesium transporter [Fodinibius salinus]